MSAAEREIRACVGLFKRELSKLVQQAIALEAKELRRAAALAERVERQQARQLEREQARLEREQARQLKREQARLEREQAKALAAKTNGKKLNGHPVDGFLSGPESSAEDGQQFTFKLDVAGAAAELEELGLSNGKQRKGNGRSSSARRKRPSNSLISSAITEDADSNDFVSDEPTPPPKPEPLFVHKRSRDGQIKTLTRVASDNPA